LIELNKERILNFASSFWSNYEYIQCLSVCLSAQHETPYQPAKDKWAGNVRPFWLSQLREPEMQLKKHTMKFYYSTLNWNERVCVCVKTDKVQQNVLSVILWQAERTPIRRLRVCYHVISLPLDREGWLCHVRRTKKNTCPRSNFSKYMCEIPKKIFSLERELRNVPLTDKNDDGAVSSSNFIGKQNGF
jgi:hypothetical protein